MTLTNDVIFAGLLIGCVIGLAYSLYGWWKDPSTRHEFIDKHDEP